MTTSETCFQIPIRMWTEPERLQNSKVELNTNLIFKVLRKKEPEQNRTLIIKEPEPNTNPKFWVISHLYYRGCAAA